MTFLTVDEIVSLHDKLIFQTGGASGTRDIGLLESAVYSAYNAYEDVEQYPTVEEKAARLAFAIVNNHAFIDGNKRIGVMVMLMTLRLNYVLLSYTQQELIDLGLSLASGTANYADTLNWIRAHTTSHSL
ncbi:MAG: type II toxin-antitoxin system death-on-curing family toxin [Oscillospiraceae bacterium]